MALGLFFIEFGLQFRSHFVVSVLCFLQVEPHLMDISQSIQVLVLIHRDIWLLIILVIVRVHHDNLSLKLFVLFPQRLLLSQFLLDGNDQFSLHFILTWHISNFIHGLFFLVQVLVFIIIVFFTLTLSLGCMSLT